MGKIMSMHSIPIDTYVVSQLLARWTVPDGSDGLDLFNDLVSIYGSMDSKGKLRKYKSLFAFTPQSHSKEFEALFKGSAESQFLDGQINRMKDALFNLLSAIAISTCMSYAFQNALFLSGIRLIDYFHQRDFGQRNPLMLQFMKSCVAEMMSQWDNARLFMMQWSDDKSHILTLCDQIPDLSPRGEIDNLYQYFHLKNQGGDTASTLISSLKLGPQGGASLFDGGASAKKKKGEKKKISAATPNAASVVVANVGTLQSKLFCRGFNSSDGCKISNCRYIHKNPPRASPEAIKMSQNFTLYGRTPSVGFVTNSE
jgi:hypothetical protein